MPLISNQKNFFLKDKEYSEDADYYLSTKVQSEYFHMRFQEKVTSWINNPDKVKQSFTSFKSYIDRPRKFLKPSLGKFQRINWEQVVLKRKSSRYFDGRPISFTELSNILLMSCGLKDKGRWIKANKADSDWPRRALPSGGGMYPLEYYVLARNVKGLRFGLYHFNVADSALSLLKDGPELQEFLESKKFWSQKDLFKKPAAQIFCTAIFHRTRVKYGPRALRYILLEAGGVGTQMNLVANAMNLDFCFDGGGFEDKIEELLDIDCQHEGLIVSFILGHSST